MSRKHVRCICHKPFAVQEYREVGEPWADVWVRWRQRPGRVKAFGPTLMARVDVVREVEKWEWCIKHYQEMGDAHMEAFARQELPGARALLQRLDAERWIFDRDPTAGTPNLYTIRPWLTRASAEELLTQWLVAVHGVHQPKFDWDRPEIFVRSM